MKIDRTELRHVAMPLIAPFRTSFGTQTYRDVLLLRVFDEQGNEGWGECVAPVEPGYSAEYVAGAELVLRAHLLPRLLAAPAVSAARVVPLLAAVRGHPMAKAAVEMAVLDAELRAADRSLADFLGTTRDSVPCGVSVGIQPSIEALLDVVAGYLEAGYVRIKLKIEPGWDVAPVRAVRERFGDGLALQVDANAAYTLADATQLARLDAFDLLLIEQPLEESALRAHAELARIVRTPLCLDESITSAQVAADALVMGACRIVNIKAGRVGGLLEARRVHDVAAALGAPAWCGGMLETGIGRAANIVVAALPNCVLPGDTSASDRYYRTDITPPFVLHDGHLSVPSGPGLGVTVDDDVLTEVTTDVAELKP